MDKATVSLSSNLPDRTPPSITSVPRVVRRCRICDAEFLVAPKIAERYSTCSRACSSIRRARDKRIHPVDATCQWCATEFENRYGTVQRFCSNDCRMQALNAAPRKRQEGVLLNASLHPSGYIRGWVWRDGKPVGMAEHRWVMEQHLGRRLTATERVHHINGDRADNRIENLRLYASQRDHLLACHVHEMSQNLALARKTRGKPSSGG